MSVDVLTFPSVFPVTDSEEVIDNRILRTVSLNTLLFVYMVL